MSCKCRLKGEGVGSDKVVGGRKGKVLTEGNPLMSSHPFHVTMGLEPGLAPLLLLLHEHTGPWDRFALVKRLMR